MAHIREYNSNATVDEQPLGQAAYRVERTGMIEGQAIRRSADSLAAGVQKIGNVMAESETSDLSAKLSGLDMDLTQQYEDAKQKGDPLDPNFARDFVEKNLEPKLSAIGDDLNTKQGQRMFAEASARMREQYFKRGVADQATFAGDKAVDNYKSSITSYANMATVDPTVTDHAASMLATLAPQLPPEHRSALLSEGQSVIYSAGAKAYLDAAIKNPDATEATLDAAWKHVADPKNGFVDHVNPDTFSALNKQYEASRETVGAARSALADQNWGDLKDRVMQNGGLDVNGEMKSLIDNYKGHNAAETQVWKAEHQKDMDEAVAYGQATEGVRTMPEQDIEAKFNAISRQIDTAAPGDLGALRAQQKAIITATQQRDKEFKEDPAAYVLQNSPVVNQRYQAYAANPNQQTFAQFAQTSLAEQTRLYPNETPKLVTNQMEQSIGTELAGVSQTPEGAAQVASTLDQFSSVMGPYWNRAAQEMFHDKVLNPAQYVAATMWSKPEAQGLAQDLLRASVIPDKDLGRGNVTSSQADKAAAQALTDFRTAMGSQANGYQVYSAYEQSLARLIQYKGTPDGAVDMANKLILDEYQFSGQLMMPAAVDRSSVIAGTKSVQADVATPARHDLVIPPSYSGTGPADQKAEYIRDVQQTGHWIMTSDNKGAMLVTERGDPVYEKVKGQTRPLVLDWQTLQKLGGQ